MTLYGAKIEEHARHPRNRGPLERPDRAREGTNPLCGDRLRVELRLEDGRVQTMRFTAEACMVSIAAASILSELVAGMSVAEAKALPREKLLGALETELRPGRVGCALLCHQILQAALLEAPGLVGGAPSLVGGRS
jgi:nitrogen fixation NifU-like protein